MKDKCVDKTDDKATKQGLNSAQVRLNLLNTQPVPVLNIKRWWLMKSY